MSINIGKNNTDPYYRYKRDELIISIEKKNGKQTKLVNIDIIQKQLKVKDDDLLNFIRKKLGVSQNKNIISGEKSVLELEKIIEKYINDYVLCKKCNLPELSENRCNACGYSSNEMKCIEKNLSTKQILRKREKKQIDIECNKSIKILEEFKTNIKCIDTIKQIDELIEKFWNCENQKTLSILEKEKNKLLL